MRIALATTTMKDRTETPRRDRRGPVGDEPPRQAPAVRTRADVDRDPVPEEEQNGFVFALMGGSTRQGVWDPPETLHAFACMGGIDLDFREADMLEGTSEVVCFALMGGIKIVVPEDIDVEVNGIGIMGGFDQISRHGTEGRPPLLRIRGLAVMGGVSVKVKPLPKPRPRLVDRIRDAVGGSG